MFSLEGKCVVFEKADIFINDAEEVKANSLFISVILLNCSHTRASVTGQYNLVLVKECDALQLGR